jgi:hypothetical protein
MKTTALTYFLCLYFFLSLQLLLSSPLVQTVIVIYWWSANWSSLGSLYSVCQKWHNVAYWRHSTRSSGRNSRPEYEAGVVTTQTWSSMLWFNLPVPLWNFEPRQWVAELLRSPLSVSNCWQNPQKTIAGLRTGIEPGPSQYITSCALLPPRSVCSNKMNWCRVSVKESNLDCPQRNWQTNRKNVSFTDFFVFFLHPCPPPPKYLNLTSISVAQIHSNFILGYILSHITHLFNPPAAFPFAIALNFSPFFISIEKCEEFLKSQPLFLPSFYGRSFLTPNRWPRKRWFPSFVLRMLNLIWTKRGF